MSDLNKVILQGRLTRSAELKRLNNAEHTPLCEFSIAVNRNRKDDSGNWISEASYFDCQLWGRYGETMSSKLFKGERVTIVGRLQQDRWEKDGEKHNRISIVVDELNMDPKRNNGTAAPAEKAEPYPAETASEQDFSEDIPF